MKAVFVDTSTELGKDHRRNAIRSAVALKLGLEFGHRTGKLREQAAMLIRLVHVRVKAAHGNIVDARLEAATDEPRDGVELRSAALAAGLRRGDVAALRRILYFL